MRGGAKPVGWCCGWRRAWRVVISAADRAVRHVFVDGRQVVTDGEVLTIDRRALAGPLQDAQTAFVRNAPYVDFRGRSADEIAPLSFRVEGKN